MGARAQRRLRCAGGSSERAFFLGGGGSAARVAGPVAVWEVCRWCSAVRFRTWRTVCDPAWLGGCCHKRMLQPGGLHNRLSMHPQACAAAPHPVTACLCVCTCAWWLPVWLGQNVVVGALGMQPQHCIIFNTLEPTGGPDPASRRIAVVVRPASTAEVLVNGTRVTTDTRLAHGDRYGVWRGRALWACAAGVRCGLCECACLSVCSLRVGSNPAGPPSPSSCAACPVLRSVPRCCCCSKTPGRLQAAAPTPISLQVRCWC